MGWQRYAVYWLPSGTLGTLGAAWLGWDARHGRPLRHALPEVKPARRYGFHATLKPPFRLAGGTDEAGLRAAFAQLAAEHDPVELGHLRVDRGHGFAALVPEQSDGISALAARLVEGLDPFRGPAPEAEVARRRAAGLTDHQDALLIRWGYPHVMDAFHPHLTLSGPDAGDDLVETARAHFAPALARPQRITAVSLVGEDALGRFHLIAEAPLG